jgi:hypothetical protein
LASIPVTASLKVTLILESDGTVLPAVGASVVTVGAAAAMQASSGSRRQRR